MYTKQEVKMNWRNYGEIVIPKGTRVSHNTATGADAKYHFVDAFEWIDEKYSSVASIMKSDAKIYGIDIPAQFVETKSK